MKHLTLERTFSAPIEKVWDALTNAEKLKQWWCPAHFEASHISVDLKKGGIFGYCFKNLEGQEFWGRGVYQNIEQPRFLSWLDTFTDSNGNPVPASHYGIPGEAIVESLVEFNLTMENGMTTMKMIGENPYDDSMLDSMKEGWNGMFDKLEMHLKQSF